MCPGDAHTNINHMRESARVHVVQTCARVTFTGDVHVSVCARAQTHAEPETRNKRLRAHF